MHNITEIIEKECHFGSQTEPAIRNVEQCEDGYPKSHIGTQRRFRSILRLFVLFCGMTTIE